MVVLKSERKSADHRRSLLEKIRAPLAHELFENGTKLRDVHRLVAEERVRLGVHVNEMKDVEVTGHNGSVLHTRAHLTCEAAFDERGHDGLATMIAPLAPLGGDEREYADGDRDPTEGR